MSVLVSIVIPVYNAAPYLDACLQSVADQSYTNLEAIIINDGSTDGSEEIVQKYMDSDSRFVLFNQENHGLGYTRNRGIALSNGSYVFFLDSDDLIPINSIQSLIAAAVKHDSDYAAGKALRITGERNYITKRQVDFKLYKKKEVLTISEQPEMLQDSIACNKLWKKDFLTQNDLYFTEGKYYEDLHMTMRAAILAKNIAVTNEVVYHWRVRENENKPSITQEQMRLQNTRDRLSALHVNREWLTKSEVDPRILAEHDLKALLDVLGLHVIKYALVRQDEREIWLKEINAFLEEIPGEAADRLPGKEKKLYDLLKERNYSDLLLLSQMYTNTETRPIVVQEGQQFTLKGTEKSFDVTDDLKPSIMVKELNEAGSNWILRGTLTIPKASFQTDGSFYGTGRVNGNHVRIDSMLSEPAAVKSLYPYEKQTFELTLDPKSFAQNKSENVYDFYYRLAGDEEKHQPARVRIHSTLRGQYALQMGGTELSLYRTNHGNLSLKIQRSTIKRMIKKWLGV